VPLRRLGEAVVALENGIGRTSWIGLSRRPKKLGVEANELNEEVDPLTVEARELDGLD
jgi:hypothetical protein